MPEVVFALDRSKRTFDVDGRLHVALANISKANICPYYGREIPDAEALGLDANTVYQVFRDPAELAKGAATFNNLPLLRRHVVVSADDPMHRDVVGSLGTDAAFADPYLQNSLVVWDADMIRRIESGEQKEISCAYRYVAVPGPGTHKGQSWDLRMTGITGNHAALVPEGRAGPDVVVADGQPETMMAIKSKKALMVSGAVRAMLRPMLAADAQIDYGSLFDGVTAKTYATDVKTIVTRLTAATAGKLAADAKLDPVVAALDAMKDDEACAEDEDDMAEDADKDDDKKAAMDAAIKAAVTDALKKAKLSPPKDPPAMDQAAITSAVKLAVDAALVTAAADAKAATENAVKIALDARAAIETARAAVRPHVGELTAAFDSACAVYKVALDAAKVDYKGLEDNATALGALVRTMPKPGESNHQPAMDAAEAGSLFKDFPGASRIQFAA